MALLHFNGLGGKQLWLSEREPESRKQNYFFDLWLRRTCLTMRYKCKKAVNYCGLGCECRRGSTLIVRTNTYP